LYCCNECNSIKSHFFYRFYGFGLIAGRADRAEELGNSDDEEESRESSKNIDEDRIKNNKKTFIQMSVDRDSDVYEMSHSKRGTALVFNQKHFDASYLETRVGTDTDVDSLR
jgi:hypothetical protein